MKICFLSCFDDLLLRDTGSAVRIFNLARSLVERKHEVHIAIPSVEGNWRKCIEGIVVHGVSGFCPSLFLRVLRKLLGVLRPATILFYDLLFILRAGRIVSSCDLVQIEQPSASGLMAPFIAVFLRKPLIADCHDVFQALRIRNSNSLRKFLETFSEKMAYRFADTVLTVSKEEKRILGYFGFRKRNIAVIPNGVDTDSFKPSPITGHFRKSFGLESSLVVVFVGNMEYSANMEAAHLIVSNIAPRVSRKVEGVKFLVVGRIPHGLKTPKSPNVIFTGALDDLPEALAAADIAIAPLRHGSGTRLKILEYFSSGLPVVSTAIGIEGIKISNGLEAFVEDDVDSFADRIISVLEDREQAAKIGQAARKLVMSKYDWRTIGEKLDSVYGLYGKNLRRQNGRTGAIPSRSQCHSIN